MKKWFGWGGGKGSAESEPPQGPVGGGQPIPGAENVLTTAPEGGSHEGESPPRSTQQTNLNSWTCPVCTLVNPNSSSLCAACGHERGASKGPVISRAAATAPPVTVPPAPSRPLGAWSCSACTFENEAEVYKCVMCGADRPLGYTAPAASQGAGSPVAPNQSDAKVAAPPAAAAPSTATNPAPPVTGFDLDDIFGGAATAAPPTAVPSPRVTTERTSLDTFQTFSVASPEAVPPTSASSSGEGTMPTIRSSPSHSPKLQKSEIQSPKSNFTPKASVGGSSSRGDTPNALTVETPKSGLAAGGLASQQSIPAIQRPGSSATTPKTVTTPSSASARAKNVAASTAAPTGNLLNTIPPSERSVVDLLFKERRYHELHAVLSRYMELQMAETSKKQLEEARLVDDRLEEAISHRDTMRQHLLKGAERKALIQFVASFPHVGCCPLLVASDQHKKVPESSGIKAISSSMTSSGFNNLKPLLKDSRKLENFVNVALVEACDLEDAICMAQCQSPSEVLLLSSLVELCRSVIRLCCVPLNSDSISGGESVPSEEPSIAVGGREISNPSFVSSAAKAKDAEEWEVILKANLALLRNTQSGRLHVKGLTQLLMIARHTLALKVRVEIQAEVSLLLAELLSLFDRLLPPGAEVPQIDRKKSSLVCDLSGMRLDEEKQGMIVKTADGRLYHFSALALWKRCSGATDFPSA